MSNVSYSDQKQKCFKCSKVARMMLSDKKLTRGIVVSVCSACYSKIFPYYKEEIK